MDRGAWWPTVHGVAKSRTRPSTHFGQLPVCAPSGGGEGRPWKMASEHLQTITQFYRLGKDDKLEI